MHVHLASRDNMKENLDCMLDKLDFILRLVRDCNFTLKRIESRRESQRIDSVPSDVRDLRVVEDVCDFLYYF